MTLVSLVSVVTLVALVTHVKHVKLVSHTPVDPNPPVPRSVSSRDVTTLNEAVSCVRRELPDGSLPKTVT